MMLKKILFTKYYLLIVLWSCAGQNNEIVNNDAPQATQNEIDFWLTKPDESVLLQKQNTILSWTNTPNTYLTISIDDSQTFQSVDGFGFTLTGGSAEVINQLEANAKAKLLRELFSNDDNAISINYLRVSIGASDLNAETFSYDDVPVGETDINLSKFSLEKDAGVIKLLQEILAINPNIKILGSPWSPPVWMKDNNSTIGGSLQPQYYAVYAQYFVKYIQEMKAKGITIDAITPQNEPLHPGNNPSLLMLAEQQSDFIKNHLGPAFKQAGITTKIITYDHNCNRPDYPITLLSDPLTKSFIDGSGFHLYEGDVSALSQVHDFAPDKNIYFTEQYTPSNGVFETDLRWHIKNVIIGTMRNWSKTALEWNLANNAAFEPHTPGGCTTCKGALTIQGQSIKRNVGYYIIAHASKFVPTNSKRIASTQEGNIYSVAFLTPDNKVVLIVLNDGSRQLFNIKYKNKISTATLNEGEVASFVIRN